jgi:hypothetical protein
MDELGILDDAESDCIYCGSKDCICIIWKALQWLYDTNKVHDFCRFAWKLMLEYKTHSTIAYAFELTEMCAVTVDDCTVLGALYGAYTAYIDPVAATKECLKWCKVLGYIE